MLKKKFISGAKCPSCGAVEALYILRDEAKESLHCIRCDFLQFKSDSKKLDSLDEWSQVKLTISD